MNRDDLIDKIFALIDDCPYNTVMAVMAGILITVAKKTGQDPIAYMQRAVTSLVDESTSN